MRYLILCLLLASCITGGAVIETGPPIKVYFCPQDNCSAIMHDYLIASEHKDCAFYDLDDEHIIDALSGGRVYMEEDNKHKQAIKTDQRSAYMHHKFCVLDEGVLTGSMNPTQRGTTINFNNLLYIPSPTIEENFQYVFDDLLRGKRGHARNPIVDYNGELIRMAVCPEDDCLALVLEELAKAEHNINFYTFSFTHPDITDLLIAKHAAGVDVQGVMEGQRITMRWNQYNRLDGVGIPIITEETGATYHHKVFVIDNRTVITGSANPTRSGYNKNDENIIVLQSPQIASAYLQALGS